MAISASVLPICFTWYALEISFSASETAVSGVVQSSDEEDNTFCES
jgi:hypothetical protein